MAKEPGGFDYLDSVSKDEGSRPRQTANLSTEQKGYPSAPVDGGEGYVGGNSNASAVGMDYVTGKKGYTTERPIWSEVTHDATEDSASPEPGRPGMDSTDEMSQKHVKSADGLPRTWPDSKGAGSADSSTDSPETEPESRFGSTEKDKEGFGYLDQAAKSGQPVNPEQEAAQSVPSEDYKGDTELEMPQTENTSAFGDGAPVFKHHRVS